MAFFIGQKVACIGEPWMADTRPWADWRSYVTHFPKIGHVYTIRAIYPGSEQYKSPPGLRLHELINPKTQYMDGSDEAAFLCEAFRPLTERKTDISIFTKMLTDKHLVVTE